MLYVYSVFLSIVVPPPFYPSVVILTSSAHLFVFSASLLLESEEGQ